MELIRNYDSIAVEIIKRDTDKSIREAKKDGYLEFVGAIQPKTNEDESALSSYELEGDKVLQKWVIVKNEAYYQNLIDEKKAQLAASDYKIIKCQESQLMGQEPPYDIIELSNGRQLLRDEINELEKYKNDENGKSKTRSEKN